MFQMLFCLSDSIRCLMWLLLEERRITLTHLFTSPGEMGKTYIDNNLIGSCELLLEIWKYG